MRKTNIFAMVLSAVLTLSGCSSDEAFTPPTNYPTDGKVRFTVNLSDATTRATLGSNADLLSSFGFCINNEASTTYTYKNVEVKRNDGGVWEPQEQLLWQNATQPVNIVACFPYDPNETGNLANQSSYQISVKADQTDKSDYSSDFLVYKKTGFVPKKDLDNNSSVPITFQHAFSLLDIHVKFGTEFNSNGLLADNIITDMKVSGSILDGFCNFTAEEPVVKAAGAGRADPVSAETGTFTAATEQNRNAIATYSCILIPQTVTANYFQVSFKINDKQYLWTSPLDVTLEQGKKHRLELTVGKETVIAGSITLSDWAEGETITGGEADITTSADATTHTVSLLEAGQLTKELIDEALNTGSELKIRGSINSNDFATLKEYKPSSLINLDLSEAETEELPSEALVRASYIKEIALPKTLKKIGMQALAFNSELVVTNWADLTALEIISDDPFNSTGLTGRIELPNSVKTIGTDLFHLCTKIESVTVPEAVNYINSHMFYCCDNLKEVIVKGNITKIYTYAFARESEDNVKLTIDLSTCTSVPEIEDNILFGRTPSNVTFKVKKDMASAFKADSDWKGQGLDQCNFVEVE